MFLLLMFLLFHTFFLSKQFRIGKSKCRRKFSLPPALSCHLRGSLEPSASHSRTKLMNVGLVPHVLRPMGIVSRGKKWFRALPSNRPDPRQQFLKAAPRAAGAKVITAKLFPKLFIPVYYSTAFLYFGFRRETFTAFAGDFERWFVWIE